MSSRHQRMRSPGRGRRASPRCVGRTRRRSLLGSRRCSLLYTSRLGARASHPFPSIGRPDEIPRLSRASAVDRGDRPDRDAGLLIVAWVLWAAMVVSILARSSMLVPVGCRRWHRCRRSRYYGGLGRLDRRRSHGLHRDAPSFRVGGEPQSPRPYTISATRLRGRGATESPVPAGFVRLTAASRSRRSPSERWAMPLRCRREIWELNSRTGGRARRAVTGRGDRLQTTGWDLSLPRAAAGHRIPRCVDALPGNEPTAPGHRSLPTAPRPGVDRRRNTESAMATATGRSPRRRWVRGHRGGCRAGLHRGVHRHENHHGLASAIRRRCQPGNVVELAAATPTATATDPPDGVSTSPVYGFRLPRSEPIGRYTVRPGDSYWSVTARCPCSGDGAIVAYTAVLMGHDAGRLGYANPAMLHPGDQLEIIPAAESDSTSSTTIPVAATSTDPHVYVVEPGGIRLGDRRDPARA